MSSTRFFRSLAALGVLSVTLIAGNAWAQPGQGHHGFDRGHGPGASHMFEGLDLTEVQKEQIHELFSSQREQGRAAHEALRTARTTLRDAIHAGTLDEGAIRAASADVAALEADQAVARAEVFQAVRQILTPEQQAKLDELKAEHAERRAGRRAERRGRHGHRGPGSDSL